MGIELHSFELGFGLGMVVGAILVAALQRLLKQK